MIAPPTPSRRARAAPGDLDFLRDHGLDPFYMPPSHSLVMLNTSHDIVLRPRLPSVEEIEALNTDTLPPRELLDPSSMRGARYRLLEKGLAELKIMLSDPHPKQRHHMDVSPKQDAAMRELLVMARWEWPEEGRAARNASSAVFFLSPSLSPSPSFFRHHPPSHLTIFLLTPAPLFSSR